MSIVREELQLQVNPSETYHISVIVGQGQKGQIAFRKPNGIKINQEEVLNESLGSGADLLTKGSMTISSMATDVQPSTNNTSLLVELNGERIFYKEKETEEDNGTVFYKIKIQFQA